jgi:hypothetical protein
LSWHGRSTARCDGAGVAHALDAILHDICPAGTEREDGESPSGVLPFSQTQEFNVRCALQHSGHSADVR